ncbi:HNH endonuclease [Bacillus sp. FJAT-49736]|uniref:HNH endonuclease n=1 Tax=Bacillus sp. FJAT-49736 TaxID=2833582 RepID=UPI0020165CF2|nr:HNH endonuclease [Bacillus sp. FJAT-49736]
MIPFYKSKEWRALRQQALERDNYECQECKEKGTVTSRNAKLEVHHIKEVKTHPKFALELWNLKTVCTSCHNKAHDRFDMNKTYKKNRFADDERW